MLGKPKVALMTLGCKVNQNETEALTALFIQHGYEVVDFTEAADVYVINTCTVTHLADKKSRQFIRRANKLNPEAQIVVMGCYAQMDPQAVKEIPGVSLVVGTKGKKEIIELLERQKIQREQLTFIEDIENIRCFEELPHNRSTQRTRAYLKVQEGCEQFCSYCIIPYARGALRSRFLEDALKEARQLIEAGFREIVLTGIHLGAYGWDWDKKVSLEDLLVQLLRLDSKVRWRLSSLEPMEVSDLLLELMVSYDNFCPHLHLPLQSGQDQILQAMNRPYTTKMYADIIDRVRKVLPEISITTDVMVGFPGEKEEHFQEYLRFVESMGFSDLHVFKYSPRRNTPAALFPQQVPQKVKEQRSQILIELARKLHFAYASKFIGKKLKVLVETELEQGIFQGHSENYLKVQFTSAKAKRGEIISVELKEVGTKVLRGEIVEKEVG